jgi:hypothetical protein
MRKTTDRNQKRGSRWKYSQPNKGQPLLIVKKGGTRTITTVTTCPQKYAWHDTQRASWHQDRITESPLAVKWLAFGLVFKRSNRSLLHNKNNKKY